MKISQGGHSPASKISEATDLSAVTDLLERRALVAAWLERLDEAPISNPRAAERVRADYRQRLDALLAELSGHRDALREQRRRVADSLDEAQTADQEARDALDEAELRHTIGEFGEDEWEDRRTSLEESVTTAAAALQGAREEAARLDEVLDSVEGGIETVPSPHGESGSGAVPHPPATGPEIDLSEPPAQPVTSESENGGEPNPDHSEFLAELDRAIEASSDTRPRPGAKCPDCGYTNDFDAWYCGVCGVDLA